ncbi:EscS/YscS/HrcS family type III secretion system export apparatus protein [Cedecea sp.]|jgi:type III secretion protein S|uniref:EscS/YscS/HrcS family type III secretion system export apparatus protein n=1 Tax=Cedecea sp. TaxID=1970739 RepID=UPI0012ADA22A|nr:EscS/YscS/HrcS family type III secretion system export apparatus protein [Enterobacteriaceae bacterium RIT693]
MMQILKQGLLLSLILSSPLLLITVTVGLIVSLLQAILQLQEQSLLYTIKLFTIAVVFSFSGNWIYANLLEFTNMIFSTIGQPVIR